MQQPPDPNQQYPQQQWQQPQMPPQQQWNPQQPPYPQQQYPQPPQYQPPMLPPKKKSHNRLWLILAAVVVVLAIMGSVASHGQTQQSAPVTQATQPVQPTQAPHRPTAQPTAHKAIPTPQASIQSQVQSLVQKSGAACVGGATVTYDADFKYAHVFESFPVTGDNSLDVGRIKQDAFAIQKAIWQAHVSGVDAVQVLFNDDTSQLRLATCEVERTTAVKLSWSSMTSDQAWSSYDTVWLSPSL